MNSIVAKVLSFAGLTGSSPTSNSMVPPQRRGPNAEQEFDKAGEVANPDVWSAYNSATARPRTLEEQLRIWDEMSHWDLMAAALNEITDEATQSDATSPGLIWYECTDKKIEEELNQMLRDVAAEESLPSQVWHTAGYGNDFQKLEYSPGEGVMGFTPCHPMEMRRYWLKRNRRCVGFRWANNKPNKDDIFRIGDQPITRAALKLNAGSGKDDLENLWYPWDFMHIRRMFRARQTEHGEPLFEEAQGIYKKLRMAIDQMVVHRAQIQPDRYVVNIDVKDLPPIEQVKIVNRWKQSLRTKLSFGSGTGGVNGQPDDFRAFYNAMALDTILWMAKPRDFGHSIEKLAGTQSVPDVHDIEMLTNLFFSIIGMPKSWIGLGDSSGKGDSGPASGKALLAQDMRFLRKIKSIRKPITLAYTWLGYFHCMLKGYDVEGLEIQALMPPIGSLEDQMKIDMLSSQVAVLDQLGDIMPKFGLPKEAWIDVVFRRYLHLPDDIIDAFLTSLPPEQEPAPLESVHQKVRDRMKSVHKAKKVMMEEIIKRLGPQKDGILVDMFDIMNGRPPRRKCRYRNYEDILRRAHLKENDLIVSGFGQLDPLQDFRLLNEPVTSVTQRFVEHTGYRGAMDAHMARYAHG
jgi:hypothetical protein